MTRRRSSFLRAASIFLILAAAGACLWLRSVAPGDDDLDFVYREPQSPLPTGRVTEDTPSLETAFAKQVSISRTPHPYGDLVDYMVMIHAPEILGDTIGSNFEVALVVCDEKGKTLVSSTLDISGIVQRPRSSGGDARLAGVKGEFRYFRFTLAQHLEKTTAVNIGRNAGMRILYTQYRLPLHPRS
jgi:hypothetical protein